ncbi:MAG TPA: trigger factor [Rhabdochlamydiaceae bacterium]|nr:trigger factor [Rhabdochlamydiaceae bacterium]
MEQKEIQPQELGNADVRISIHRKPACRVEFSVTASTSIVQDAHKKAVKAIAKEVTLPGFRKGKAPEQLVLKNFPGQIEKKWQEEIADVTFKESEKIANVPLLSRDAKVSYDIKNYSFDKGAELVFAFETEPTIPAVDPKEFQMKEVQRPEVNEQKIEETIRQVQLFFAEWKKITDRPAQEKDFVLLDVDVIEDDPPSKLFSDTRFEIADKSMAKWMKDLVIGMSDGDSAEGVSVPDEDAKPEEKEELKPKKVRITVKAIEEPIAPEIDDHFAKRLGVANLGELRESISKLLNKQADAHVLEAQRELASEFLLSHYVFDLPTSLIHREAQFRMRQLLQDPQFQQYWGQMNEEERKNTTNSILKQAEKAVRMFYLCRKIISDANIPVTPRDIHPAPSSVLEALLSPKGHFEHQNNPEMHQAEAYSRLVLEKAEDYVIQNAGKA